jgi:hypothetical protein
MYAPNKKEACKEYKFPPFTKKDNRVQVFIFPLFSIAQCKCGISRLLGLQLQGDIEEPSGRWQEMLSEDSGVRLMPCCPDKG